MKDKLIRVLGANDEYVLKVAETSNLVRHAQAIQDYGKEAITYLGSFLTGALLMEDSSKNENEVLTLELSGDGPLGKVVAIADSKGNVRGFAAKPASNGGIGNGFLTASKDQGMKTPYVTNMPLAVDDVENNLMYYYASYEQLPTYFSLGVSLSKNGRVSYAYGFMLQALPFASKEIMEKIADNLEKAPKKEEILKARMSPEQIASSLLEGLSKTETEEKAVRFRCSCSRKFGLKVLKDAGKEELSSLIEEGGPIEVVCGSCGKRYSYTKEEAENLLKS